jgi:exodeoxyribonuclease VII small subunit
MSAKKKKANPDEEPKNFEVALERLEEIVDELEGGEASLDKAVALYEEGVKIFRYGRDRLNAAQKRVEELAGEVEEVLSLRPFEEEEDQEGEEE